MTSEFCCKMSRTASEYGQEDLLERLGEKWVQENGEGVRKLTDAFNKRILHVRLIRSDVELPDDVVEDLLEDLDQDDDSVGGITSRFLRNNGIDPNVLLDDLPSYKTFHRHLTDCEGREKPNAEISSKNVLESVRGYQAKLSRDFENNISSLSRSGKITCGEVDVLVEFSVKCHNCNTRSPVERVINAGCPGCD